MIWKENGDIEEGTITSQQVKNTPDTDVWTIGPQKEDLLVTSKDPKFDHILRIALLRWESGGSVTTEYEVVFHGTGVIGLRELRHLWFFPQSEGYGFYANLSLFEESRRYLLPYFDNI